MAKVGPDIFGSVLNLGSTIGQGLSFAAGLGQRQAVGQVNTALADMNKEMNNYHRAIEKRADYENFEKDYLAFESALRADLSGGLSSKMAQNMFEEQFNLASVRSHAVVGAIADQTSLSTELSNLASAVMNVQSTRPPGIVSPKEYLPKQEQRIAMLVDSAVAAGVDPGQGETIKRNALYQMKKDYSMDLMNEAEEILLGSGRDPEEVKEVLEKALRLDGAEYQAFIESGDGKLIQEAGLMDLAEAYGMIDLLPQDEELLINFMRGEVSVKAARQERDLEKSRGEFREGVFAKWTEDDWNSWSEDDYRAIRNSVLTNQEQAHFIDLFKQRQGAVDDYNAQVAEGKATAAANVELQEKLRLYDANIEEIRDVGNYADIEAMKKVILNDSGLDDVASRIRINELNSVQSDMDKGEGAGDKKAYNDLTRGYDQEIMDFRMTTEVLKRTDLVELGNRISADEELTEPDRTERQDDVARLVKDFDESPETAIHPDKTLESVELAIGKQYWNSDIAPEKVKDYVRSLTGLGLSTDDTDKWIDRITNDRIRQLGFDNFATTQHSLERFFEHEMATAEDREERVALEAEYRSGMSSLDRLINNEEFLKKDKVSRKLQLDATVNGILLQPAIRTADELLAALFGGNKVDYNSVENLKYLADNNTSGNYDDVIAQVYTELLPELRKELITEKLFPEGSSYSTKLINGEFIFTHDVSGWKFKKSRIAATRWRFQKPGEDTWTRVTAARVKELFE